MADEEMSMTMAPIVRNASSEFWVAHTDQAIVSGTASYRIPARAMGGSLRDVTFVNDSGSEVSLPQLPMEEAIRFRNSSSGWWQSGMAFFMEGDKITLLPSPTQAAGYLRMYYVRRPNRLVAVSAAATITSVASNVYTASGGVPSTMSTTTALDLVDASPNFDWLTVDNTPTGKTGTTITFASAVSEAVAGDYICLANESCVLQLPVELQPILVNAVVVRVLEALGDREGMVAAELKLQRQSEVIVSLLTPRVQGEAPRIINRSSPLRRGGKTG